MSRFKFFTFNIDFNTSNKDESKSLRSIEDEADVIFVQEAKHLQVTHALGVKFRVHQNLRSQAKQGVALAWRKHKVLRYWPTPGKRPIVKRIRGYILGVSNLGLRMLPRYINFRLLVFNGKTICCISTHRPPQRFRRLWSLFDKALLRFVRHMPFPVIIGMDSNEHTHAAFAKESNLVWHGIGIDGFYISKSLEVHVVKGSLQSHPKVNSDHNPISIELDI